MKGTVRMEILLGNFPHHVDKHLACGSIDPLKAYAAGNMCLENNVVKDTKQACRDTQRISFINLLQAKYYASFEQG